MNKSVILRNQLEVECRLSVSIFIAVIRNDQILRQLCGKTPNWVLIRRWFLITSQMETEWRFSPWFRGGAECSRSGSGFSKSIRFSPFDLVALLLLFGLEATVGPDDTLLLDWHRNKKTKLIIFVCHTLILGIKNRQFESWDQNEKRKRWWSIEWVQRETHFVWWRWLMLWWCLAGQIIVVVRISSRKERSCCCDRRSVCRIRSHCRRPSHQFTKSWIGQS